MRMKMDAIEYIDPAAPADLTTPRFGAKHEARKIRRMIRFLKDAGFRVHSLAIEGEGYVSTPTESRAVCEVFEWDAYLTLRFKRKDADRLYGVLLVTGNGEDVISNWSDDRGRDTDSPGLFTAAMDAFLTADETRDV